MAITRSQQARQMLKTAGAVEQDGFQNYIKNSESVTVPRRFKSRKNATPTKLAYITNDEAKMLKKMKKGTPHKGPKGIPSYDDFDAKGNFRSGAAMSAAETGAKTERQRADLRQAGISPQEARDIRLAAIASGAGQRVNPGFFDSRNVIPRADVLAAKKAFPKAFRKSRGGGLFGFLGSGGILGNLIRGIGRGLGLGKKFNEPTYDMRQFSNLGLFEPSVNPVFDDGSNEDLLSIISDANTVAPQKVNTKGIVTLQPDNILANTGDAFNYLDFDAEDLLGGTPTPKKSKPTINKNIIQDDFIDSLPNDVADNLMAELSQKQLNYLNSPKGKSDLELLGPRAVFEDRLPLYEDKPFFGSDQEPTTKDEFNEYLRSIGSTQIV